MSADWTGRALDVAIATQVLGWQWYQGAPPLHLLLHPTAAGVAAMVGDGLLAPSAPPAVPTAHLGGVPAFSADPAYVLPIMAALSAHGFLVRVTGLAGVWGVGVEREGGARVYGQNGALADVPRLLCLGALRAVGGQR